MATSSLPYDNDNATLSTVWGFLGAPMVGNASFLAGSLHVAAIAFKWFLRLLLLLLAVGVVIGIGSLISGSLSSLSIGRGGKSKTSTNEDARLDAELVELEFMAADYDESDDEG